MNNTVLRSTAIIMLSILFLSMIPIKPINAAPKTYVDVKGHKYEKELLYVIEKGLMSNTGNKMLPDSRLTKGAVCASLNSLLGAVEEYPEMDTVGNLKRGDKYYLTVSRGLNCGYLSQKSNGDVYSPLAPATYQYVIDIMEKIFGRSWYSSATRTIKGLNEKDILTRGELAYILYHFVPNIITKSTDKIVPGDVYIRSSGVTLSNVIVYGNLIATDGVKNKTVTLNNVRVLGTLIVRGNAEYSINITGDSDIEHIDIMGNADRIDISSTVYIPSLAMTYRRGMYYVSLNNITPGEIVVFPNDSRIHIGSKTVIDRIYINLYHTELSISGKVKEIFCENGDDNKVTVKDGGHVGLIFASNADYGDYSDSVDNLAIKAEKGALIDVVYSGSDNTAVKGSGAVGTAIMLGSDYSVTTKDTFVSNQYADYLRKEAAPKDENDVKLLLSIISELRAAGANVSENLDYDNDYVWDEDTGRLVTIYWGSDKISGSLDLSGFQGLRAVYLGNNQLTSLNVSGLNELEELFCYHNKLTSLDVSGLKKLKQLECYNNKLTTLNVKGAVKLTSINCKNNKLKGLDVSSLIALRSLDVSQNQLTSLKAGTLHMLYSLKCDDTVTVLK